MFLGYRKFIFFGDIAYIPVGGEVVILSTDGDISSATPEITVAYAPVSYSNQNPIVDIVHSENSKITIALHKDGRLSGWVKGSGVGPSFEDSSEDSDDMTSLKLLDLGDLSVSSISTIDSGGWWFSFKAENSNGTSSAGIIDFNVEPSKNNGKPKIILSSPEFDIAKIRYAQDVNKAVTDRWFCIYMAKSHFTNPTF